MVATLNKPTVAEYEGIRKPTVAEFERAEPSKTQDVWPTLPVDSSRFIAPMPERGRGRITKPVTTYRQEEIAKRPRWDEFIDATARGVARVGSAGYQAGAFMEEWPPMTAPGMRPAEPLRRQQIQKRKIASAKLRKKADFLWKLSQHPEIAARNKDLASKALNLIGETIPYITATTAGYVTLGPMGGFTVGAMVEGNSAYRTALEYGVPETKAKKIGVGVGVVSGAVEAFGGRYAEQLLIKATAKLKTKVAKAGAVFGIGTVVEALEEGAQEIAAITGEETYRDVNWNERVSRTLGAMAGGGFLGGAMRGGSMAARGIIPETPPTAPIVAPRKPVAPITKPKAAIRPERRMYGMNLTKEQAEKLAQEVGGEAEGYGEKWSVWKDKPIRKPLTKAEPTKVRIDNYLKHIDEPKKPVGFVAVPIPKSVQESARRAELKVKRTAENIKEDIDKFKFYPNAPPEFRNAVRTDMIGAMTKATHNVYENAQEAIWGDLNKRDVQKSVEILYARDQLSRTKLGKGNPEVSLEQAQEILDKTIKDASPEAISAADRFKSIHDKYTEKLVERGILSEGQRIEDHVRHYVEDYTPEWAPFANIPTRLKRPFRGYAKKAVGTIKEYRQDQESLLASLMEMEHHNLIEDFVETQVKKYDIKPSLSKEVKRKLFGTDARGYAKVPRPGRIYIHEGKRYRAYTPDIPFSRAIYMTEEGEAALGSFKNVALIPEDMYNLFRDFSQRGSRAVYLLNRATGYWKTMAILSHFPSFNVNNMVGDTWVAMAQHPKPLSLLEEYDTSIRYLTGRLEPKYRKQLDDFIIKHDIKQTFAQAELAIGRKAKNPIAWLLRKSYKISDFRESINRVAYASSLLKANQRGEGAKMVEAHDWIDTNGLSTEDSLGKIAREVLVDYQAQSKTFRRFVRGGVAPFGTWYFKMSKTMWKWFSKHPLKAMAMFVTLPLAAVGYNRRRKEIRELEQQLPDYIRNRTHFILGENPDGTVRVLSLQIPQDVLIGTKIFSIAVDYGNRVIAGEMNPKKAAIETMKRWGISEYEGAKYLLTPWIRMYSGLKTGKDPYDKAPVYRRDYDKMTWDEKAKDISAYILKTSVPFLGYTIQTYEKGLPQDVAFKKIMNSLAGKGALGIYDINKKGQVIFDIQGKKMTFEWEDIHQIHKLTAREYKYLGQLEDAFVASEQSPIEFLGSQKAKDSLLKIYDVWAERIPDLKKETNKDARIRIVAASLGERLTNRVTKPRIMAKWYQVKISRAKTAAEKRQIAKEYAEVKKRRLIEVYKALPKTAREIEMVRKIKAMD